jgi:hypothetical protein
MLVIISILGFLCYYSFSITLSLSHECYADYNHPNVTFFTTLIHPIIVYDSTESVIQRMIQGMRNFIREDKNGNSISDSSIISPVLVSLFHFKIQTLQNAPRDPSKLEQIIRAKESQKNDDNKARHVQDIQRQDAVIEMLKVILYQVRRNDGQVWRRSTKVSKEGN